MKTGSARVPARQAAHPSTRRLQVEALEGRRVLSLVPTGDYSVGLNPQSVVAADFDNDGRLDLATADMGSGTVSLLRGNGDGTFQAASQSAAYYPKHLAVGDFDGDGNADLVTLDTQFYTESVSGRLEVLLGNGDGSFQVTREVAIPEPPELPDNQYMLTLISYAPVGVRVTDVNADGRSDLGVYASYSFAEYGTGAIGWGDYFVVLLCAADGTFQEDAGGPELSPPPADPDMNGDSLGDGVATADAGVSVRLAQAGGGFSVPLLYPAGLNPRGVAFGDFNGDAQPDVAVANAGSHDVTVLLNDGDWPAADAPTIRVGDVTVTEGHAGTVNAPFTVTLSAAYHQVVTVDYLTSDSSATAGSDYQAASGTLTIPAGQTTGTITVLVNGDRLGEPDETFFVNLSGATNAAIGDGQGVGTIRDDEPRIVINDVTVTEGNTGSVNAVFTVTLSFAYDEAVTVPYATADGTATAGSDYTAISGDVIFAPGQTSQTIAVAVLGDRLPEPTESFFVNLSAPSNAALADGQGVGTVADDEPRVSISDVTKYEGKRGKTTLFTFTVTLSAAYDEPVTLSYSTTNGTATTGDNDYVAKSGTLTFAVGETTKTITIEVKGDSKKESNETFYLDLYELSSNALFTKNRGIGTILNDD